MAAPINGPSTVVARLATTFSFEMTTSSSSTELSVSAEPDVIESLSIVETSPGVWVVSGMAPDAPSVIEIEVQGDGGQTHIVELVVDWWATSPLAHRLVFTEVMYHDDGGTDVPDEALEIRNIGSDPVDLTGLMLLDRHLFLDAPDVVHMPLEWQIPGQDLDGEASMLQPGERALITMAHPADGDPSLWSSQAHLNYSVQDAGFGITGAEVWFNGGDDLWLLDADGDLVAFMSWKNEAVSGNNITLNPPHPAHGLWSDELIGDLGVNTFQRSIALASDGPGAANSACWEANGSGDASARITCLVPTWLTVDNDPVASDPARNTSLGAANTP